MVSGPAAGFTTIVLSGIGQVGGFARFLPAVVLGGALQLRLGAARAGVVAYYILSSVIQGMLAAIGLTLVLKQLPHAVGYDADYEGDFGFLEPNGGTTFSAIGDALRHVQPGAIAAARGGRAQPRRFDYDALESLLAFRATAQARGIDYRLVGVPEVETTPAH